MTIVYKARNVHKNADGLSRWAVPKTPEIPAYFPENAEPQITIEGINITDVEIELFQEARDSYKQDSNFHILTYLLDKYLKDASWKKLLHNLWKTSYYNGRFHLFDFNLYHRSKHTCVISLCSRMLINIILLECHGNISFLNLSEDREMQRIKTCAWWPSRRKYVIECFYSCDRCQKANKATGKIFVLMIPIQYPSTSWEVVHIDWVTALPPGGEKSYNASLVVVDRYRKTQIFLTCHKDYTDMDKAILILNRVIYHTSPFKNIINDRDPKFTCAL
ncbi:hypothetical protein O181_132949 [Austropuccinia psidii MF-1]|uniref:Integrase zinc-binding domain-containing protein n=1 Tax=Austropuccinia psidii MF-1 TaxID=1389203 RepID=A0A9Q3L5T4_9BASI|nr:hypothetical protein [Austropuccinia psidii MF-1]